MERRALGALIAVGLAAFAGVSWWSGGGAARDGGSRRGDPSPEVDQRAALIGSDVPTGRTAPESSPEPPAEARDGAEDSVPAPAERPPLRCRVVRDGHGVPGCEVALLDGGEAVFVCVTGADGRFVLPREDHMGSLALEIRTSTTTLRSKGLARRRDFNGTEVRVFHIGHTTLNVTVFGADGEPAEGVPVAVGVAPDALPVRYRSTAETDGRGRVRFTELPAGSITLQGGSAPPNQVELRAPGDASSIEAELGPSPDGHPVVVRVLAPDGTGLQTQVDLRAIELATDRVARADPDPSVDGTYRFRLRPGRYLLESRPELAGSPMTMEVTAGLPVIELRASGAVIRGLLGNHEPRYSGPVARMVSSPYDAVLRDAETDEVVAQCRIKDAGTFEFTGVPPGAYALSGARGRLDPPMTEVPVAIGSRDDVVTVDGLALREQR